MVLLETIPGPLSVRVDMLEMETVPGSPGSRYHSGHAENCP